MIHAPSPLGLQLKKLGHGQDLPTPFYATSGSAGFDLMAAIDAPLTIEPGKRTLVPCGFAMALPQGYEAQVRPRSGLAFKQGITVLNTPGTIDSDYRGEIKVILINLGQNDVVIERGMRIAQMIIAPYVTAQLQEVTDFKEEQTLNQRGEGGFGSTGIASLKATA